MLVLTRKDREAILIGEDIRVVVVGIKGDRVRLGVIAPGSVRVDRREVHERRVNASADPTVSRYRRSDTGIDDFYPETAHDENC